MATVTPILRTSKKDRQGRCPIWLRISDRDGTRYLSLGKEAKVLPSQWNDRQRRVRKGHPHAALINRLLEVRLDEAQAEMLRLKIEREEATASHLKEKLTPGVDRSDFFAYAEHYVDQLRREGNVRRERRLKGMLSKLEAVTGRPLPFGKLTVGVLNDFQSHCVTELGNKQSSIAANLSDIRALVNRAVKEGVVDAGDNPFSRFSIKRGPRTERARLSFEEIQRLEALDVEAGTLSWHVRNLFLFAFYSAGIRFGDAVTMKAGRVLEHDDGTPDRLLFQAGKTGKRHSIKITPPARRILDCYLTPDKTESDFIFPLLDGYDVSTPRKLTNAISSRNALVNRYLKDMANAAGISKQISTHVARHSFADAARAAGWNLFDISKALGHSKLEITQRYLASFDAASVDAGMDELFGS
ncbi:MAG: site-specific integrase [Bacteroidota bacterium]